MNNFLFMTFSQKKIYLVIALTIVSLIGILLVQYFWIDAALETEKEQFDREIATVTQKLENNLRSDSELQNRIINFADSSTSTHESDIKEELRNKLQNEIDEVFNAEFTNLDYEFGLVQHSDFHKCCQRGVSKEKVLLSSMEENNRISILKTDYRSCPCIFAGNAHINLHFPNKDYFVASQIGGMLALSVICILIVVGCFSYTILTIRKQKKLADMKNDFINNMTHEFKTPIFSISLASKALGKSKQLQKSEKLNSFLNLIHDESKRLKEQVDKVLQMTLADSNYSKINKEKINLHKLIKNEADKFKLILSEKNGTINLDLQADKHMIHADKTHLTNIIQNLIDNAIKYSKQQPDITIFTENKDEGVSFSITDNGIGMDSETKQHVFEKFYRATQSGDIHNVKGFGLGLSYVKNIVKAHQGRIQIDSKINKGSTFTIFLPA